ncbi:MAG: RagB/SusD family nutrient uptake outer membrane protein [Alistipes sp.]|nr:RagB/SusD family nutrient uptake outer membrane protein [Alistipes sp.]
MKKWFYSLLAVCALTGCGEGFLDTDNLSSKDSSNFPVNVNDAEEILTGIYRPVMGDSDAPQNNVLFIAELMSDERLGGAGKDDAVAQSVANYMKTSDNMYSGLWSRCYQGIYRCNFLFSVEEQIDWAGDDEARKRIIGEGHFMRAYYYFDLLRLFENVPMPLVPEPANLPQAPVDEAYGQVAADLLQAIELLPDTKHAGLNGVGTDGHATKWAAEALLARVFLFYTGVYAKTEISLPGDAGTLTKSQVVDHLKDCIDNSGHDLAEKFGDLWAYSAAGDYWINKKYGYNWLGDCAGWTGWEDPETGETTQGYRDNPETIFAIKHAYGNQYYGRNLTVLFFSPRYQDADNPNGDGAGWGGIYPFGTGWGGGSITYDIYETWPEGDQRRDASILNVDAPEEVLPAKSGEEPQHMMYHDNGGHQVEDTHLFNKKYIAINVHSEKITSKDNQNGPGAVALYWYCYPEIMATDNDYMSCNFMDEIAIRFADVLLMHSELTGTADGITRVRARVGLAPVGYSEEALQNERRWELAFEGIRFFDLKRWGKLDLVTAHRSNIDCWCDGNIRTISVPYRPETKGWLPIPDEEIQKSQGMLRQNTGWSSSEGNYSGKY